MKRVFGRILLLVAAIVVAVPACPEDWPEWDVIPVRALITGRNAIIVYQYKLKFLSIPVGASLSQNEKTRQYELHRGTETITVDSLKPRAWTFKHPFSLVPMKDTSAQEQFLLCRHGVFSTYSAQTEEERKIIDERMHSNWGSVEWTNDKGETDQFCGIITSTGSIKYQFPLVQGKLKPVVETIGISTDGFHAAIGVGERIISEGEDGDSPIAGNFTEIWLWDMPDKLVKKPIPQTNDIVELRSQFYRKEF